jgi:hypothetical protein
MNRKYQATNKQTEKWNSLKVPVMPTDEEFKRMWKSQHNKKETGWGMGKRDWMIAHANDSLEFTADFNYGLWEGRVDGLNKRISEVWDESEAFQYGYRKGLATFESFWKGCDPSVKKDFSEKYLEEK